MSVCVTNCPQKHVHVVRISTRRFVDDCHAVCKLCVLLKYCTILKWMAHSNAMLCGSGDSKVSGFFTLPGCRDSSVNA